MLSHQIVEDQVLQEKLPREAIEKLANLVSRENQLTAAYAGEFDRLPHARRRYAIAQGKFSELLELPDRHPAFVGGKVNTVYVAPGEERAARPAMLPKFDWPE